MNQYLWDHALLLIFLAAGGLFVLISLQVARLIRPNRPNEEKLSTYESGEDPEGGAWTQFNTRFYSIALIFLLFEVELIFLFPWAVIWSDPELLALAGRKWSQLVMIEIFIFIALLLLGLFYAWQKGYLDWEKASAPEAKALQEQYQSPVPDHYYEKINKQY